MNPRQNAQHRSQRFSWQMPPEEEAPPYEPPQQHPPRAETNANHAHLRSPVYSYTQTPIEHRGGHYAATTNHPPLPQSPTTPIDSRPQAFHNTLNQPTQSQSNQAHVASTTYPDEKGTTPQKKASYVPPFSPDDIQSPTTTTHARKLSSLSQLNTTFPQRTMPQIPETHTKPQADPLPPKTALPISPGPTKPDPTDPSNRRSQMQVPYSPHSFPTTPSQSHALYSPHAAHGPNGLDFSLHQPGQIAHPNMDLPNPKSSAHEWKHSLCECGTSDCSTCLTGLICPCILYGRTSYRLAQKSDKKDPTDLLGHSATNGHCLLMTAACGLWWLFPIIQRTRIRHLYKIDGGVVGDVARGCCCCCCVVVQNEREVREREESARRWAGPASSVAYAAGAQMVYRAQR